MLRADKAGADSQLLLRKVALASGSNHAARRGALDNTAVSLQSVSLPAGRHRLTTYSGSDEEQAKLDPHGVSGGEQPGGTSSRAVAHQSTRTAL